MDRIPDSRYGETIGKALELVSPVRHLIGCRFVCGVDPIFAGLHKFDDDFGGGLSYSNTAHCCYPYHLSGPADRRATTVVLPEHPSVRTVVHELGHALHWRLGLEHVAEPINGYAETNHHEAFAEAFRFAILGPWAERETLWAKGDKATQDLWRRLGVESVA